MTETGLGTGESGLPSNLRGHAAGVAVSAAGGLATWAVSSIILTLGLQLSLLLAATAASFVFGCWGFSRKTSKTSIVLAPGVEPLRVPRLPRRWAYGSFGVSVVLGITIGVVYSLRKPPIGTSVGPNPNQSVIGSPGATVVGPGGSLTQNYSVVPEKIVTEIMCRFERALGSELARLTDTDRIVDAVRSGVDRTRVRAAGGDPEALAAIETLKRSGDFAQVQTLLTGIGQQLLREAEADEPDARERCAEVWREIAEIAVLREKIDEARDSIEVVLSLFPEDLSALARHGYIQLRRGDNAAARKSWARLLELAPCDEWRVIAHYWLGYVPERQDDFAAMATSFERARMLAEQIGWLMMETFACGQIQWTWEQRGDTNRAEEFGKIFRKLDERFVRLDMWWNDEGRLGPNHGSRVDIDEVEQHQTRALAIAEKTQNSKEQSRALHSLGLALRARGQLDSAAQTFRRALEIDSRSLRRQYDVVRLNRNLGQISWVRGDLGTAEALFMSGLKILEDLPCIATPREPDDSTAVARPANLELAALWFNLGAIAWQRGNHANAEENWNKTRAEYTKLGETARKHWMGPFDKLVLQVKGEVPQSDWNVVPGS